MLIKDLVLSVLSEHYFYTTIEVCNKVNNIYEMDLNYNQIHNALTELKKDMLIKKQRRQYLDEWLKF